MPSIRAKAILIVSFLLHCLSAKTWIKGVIYTSKATMKITADVFTMAELYISTSINANSINCTVSPGIETNLSTVYKIKFLIKVILLIKNT